MPLDRPLLQSWMEKHRIALTPEAIGEILALATAPAPIPARAAAGVASAAARGFVRDVREAPLGLEVTEAQIQAFAGYLEGDPETVWYRTLPTSPWDGEFAALRALASDLRLARVALRRLHPLWLVFRSAVRYRDCWTPNCVMSVSQAARELVASVREAEELMTNDRDVSGQLRA
jgi:hypothetical protein